MACLLMMLRTCWPVKTAVRLGGRYPAALSVPAIGVHGRYYTSGAMAGGNDRATPRPSAHTGEIAIVGMAGRFPGADNRARMSGFSTSASAGAPPASWG